MSVIALNDSMKSELQDSNQQTSVATLLTYVEPTHPDTPLLETLERFVSQSTLYAIPVVSNGSPVGLINRNSLIEMFSKPFTRELFGRNPNSTCMGLNPLIVDLSEAIDDMARIIIDAGMQYMYDGFIITKEGNYVGMGTGHDLLNKITESKQRHLFHLAHYDQLTGLPNRLLFNDRLSHACAHANRNESLGALFFIDLDKFKNINDTHGHPIGDRVLKTVSIRLTECLRSTDTVARLCGDEFTVILEDIPNISVVRQVAEKILESLTQAIHIDNIKLIISASIGISLFPFQFDDNEDTLVKKADAAMYYAKARGRNNFQFYSAEMNAAIYERIRIENNLRYALERDEFKLHYQPQVELSSGKIIGVEVLIRWQHPEMGWISPADFIPIAEDNGMILAIGERVLREACKQGKRWQDMGLPSIKIAVNLSARQIRSDLPDLVSSILDETGLEPGCLELELTENILLENIEETICILAELNKLGIESSIDDFGTGYSSLSYLQRLPISTLKIDRSFLIDIQDKHDISPIITTIIGMAHNLNLKVIAEGMETCDQLEFLRLYNCDQAQGYYFSRPCSPDDLESILGRGNFSIECRKKTTSKSSPADRLQCY